MSSCTRCPNQLQAGDKFCNACGVVVAVFERNAEARKILCMHCGSGLRGQKNYCTACGFKVKRKGQGGMFQRFSQALGSPRVQLVLGLFTIGLLGPAIYVALTTFRPGPPQDLMVHSAYVIHTVAGPGEEASGDHLVTLNGVVRDERGNVYIADAERHQVMKRDSNGTIRPFAGTGDEGFEGDDGPAYAARLSRPAGLAIDAAGSVYIADTGNHRIRRVGPDGVIQTIAGGGPTGAGKGSYSGDGELATLARLDSPRGVFSDSEGTIYFSDAGNRRVRRLEPLKKYDPSD